jgi:hypothetical protein
MLQGPVRDTVRARSLADLETPDGFLNSSGVVNLGSLAGVTDLILGRWLLFIQTSAGKSALSLDSRCIWWAWPDAPLVSWQIW